MNRTVGVLGGMGPAATVAFLGRLIALTPATRDQDHIRVLTDCNPQVPERNAAQRGDGPSPGPVLAGMARGLAAAGADLLVMPCNTAHAFADAIRAAVAIPFVSMIDTAAEAVRATGAARVGLLAVDGALAANLYQPLLPGPVLLDAGHQARFMALIGRIKAGDAGAAVRAGMAALAGRLVADGAEAVLAACTEIPLVLAPDGLPVPLLDSAELLARRTVAIATG